MGTVAEIEDAIQKLPPEKAWEIAKWLQEYLDTQWDKQIEEDAKSGALDKLCSKAKADVAARGNRALVSLPRDYNSSPGTGGTSGTFAMISSNAL